MRRSVGVDEVQGILLDRVLTGAYPVGSRLPSCRALARELGSNPSTVDRAIGRLSALGRLSTEPRRGCFVEPLTADQPDARSVLIDQLENLLLRARRLGFTSDELTAMVGEGLRRVDALPRIAVVECNERDLRAVQHMVQQMIDVEVQPVLLSDVKDRMLDREFDAVAVPSFHLSDVVDLVDDVAQVVELNLVASRRARRQRIAVKDEKRLTVVAPSARGIQWMKATVGQYFPGQVDTLHVGTDDLSALDNTSIVVRNNAANVPDEVLAGLDRVISIEWELDDQFVANLRSRVEQVVAVSSGAQQAPEPQGAS